MRPNQSRTLPQITGKPGSLWANVGIFDQIYFEGLFYSPAAKLVIAHFSNERRIYSLFARELGEKNYQRLTPKKSNLSYWSPVLVPTRPLLYVNVMRQENIGGREHPVKFGFKWDYLAAIDLKSGKLRPVITKRDLHRMTPSASKQHRITDLFGCSANGRHLYCVIGMTGNNLASPNSTEFSVYDLDVTRKSLRKLSILNNPFT